MSQLLARKRGLFFRKSIDYGIKTISILSTLLGVFFLAWILYVVFKMGFRSFLVDESGNFAFNYHFFVDSSKPYGFPDSGVANALLGTVMISLGAVGIGVPPGLLAGIYLSEFSGQSKAGNFIRFSANVMMGIPSIIVGLFVYALMVYTTKCFSGFAGSVALAIIIFPVVTRTTEDMLSMVPNALRESALAIGTPRWKTTLHIIFRAAKSGLITGVLLSVARVSGETAPLLFTALWSDNWPVRVIPWKECWENGRPLVSNLNENLLSFFHQPTANLTVLTYEYATNSPYETMHIRAWGAALLITFLVLMLNIICRTVFREKKR